MNYEYFKADYPSSLGIKEKIIRIDTSGFIESTDPNMSFEEKEKRVEKLFKEGVLKTKTFPQSIDEFRNIKKLPNNPFASPESLRRSP